ncbi:hypothetical protein [Hyalangium rubrum]|uniref:Lipoprotein n=1 Tax=Hyalangium rubrum TaxID=3103134 RepID=A0ABU5HAH6_9BACT|nr:hypothetical protein [Hyalangium sp. s54d21]MDY7230306.1 hypothetical protein [Hyalangium sp. s54d21]
MQKVTWTALGVVGLSLLLCGQGETTQSPSDTVERDATDTRVQGTQPGDARVGVPESAPPVGMTEGTGGGGAAGATGAGSVESQRLVLELQSEVARLRQELAQVRAELANATASTGVGGSGQAGGASQDTGTGGSTATAPRGGASTGTTDPGQAIVNAIYTGTVRSVSNGRLELLDEEGQAFTVEMGQGTRVYRDGQRITARQLTRGTRVRATVDLLAGHNQATEIIALPTPR